MVWAIGFGFQEVQAKPKPYPGQHFWVGMAEAIQSKYMLVT